MKLVKTKKTVYFHFWKNNLEQTSQECITWMQVEFRDSCLLIEGKFEYASYTHLSLLLYSLAQGEFACATGYSTGKSPTTNAHCMLLPYTIHSGSNSVYAQHSIHAPDIQHIHTHMRTHWHAYNAHWHARTHAQCNTTKQALALSGNSIRAGVHPNPCSACKVKHGKESRKKTDPGHIRTAWLRFCMVPQVRQSNMHIIYTLVVYCMPIMRMACVRQRHAAVAMAGRAVRARHRQHLCDFVYFWDMRFSVEACRDIRFHFFFIVFSSSLFSSLALCAVYVVYVVHICVLDAWVCASAKARFR